MRLFCLQKSPTDRGTVNICVWLVETWDRYLLWPIC